MSIATPPGVRAITDLLVDQLPGSAVLSPRTDDPAQLAAYRRYGNQLAFAATRDDVRTDALVVLDVPTYAAVLGLDPRRSDALAALLESGTVTLVGQARALTAVQLTLAVTHVHTPLDPHPCAADRVRTYELPLSAVRTATFKRRRSESTTTEDLRASFVLDSDGSLGPLLPSERRSGPDDPAAAQGVCPWEREPPALRRSLEHLQGGVDNGVRYHAAAWRSPEDVSEPDLCGDVRAVVASDGPASTRLRIVACPGKPPSVALRAHLVEASAREGDLPAYLLRVHDVARIDVLELPPPQFDLRDDQVSSLDSFTLLPT